MGITLQGLGAIGDGAVAGHTAGSKRINERDANSRANASENRTARDDQFSQTYNLIMQERPDIGAGQPAQPAGPAQALPGGTPPSGAAAPPAGANFPDRRAHYNDWHTKARNAALRAGGLDGQQAFMDAENLNSMQEMQTWGEQGVLALSNNSPADAAKFFNTMFEVSPTDFGLEMEAFEGKLYMKGRDGKRGAPIGQAEAMAYMDAVVQTPENYLAMQEKNRLVAKDAETARSALVKEGTEQQRVDAVTKNAATQEAVQKLEEKFAERGMQVDEANALASLITAKAADKRAARAIASGFDNGWKTGDITKLMNDSDAWALDKLDTTAEVQQYYSDDPTAWALHKSDVQNMQLRNPPGMITRDEASLLSQFVRFPGDKQELGQLAKDVGISGWQTSPETGQLLVTINGKQVRLDPGLAAAAQKNIPALQQAAPAEEGGPDAALPTGGNKEANTEAGVLQDTPAEPEAPGAVSKGIESLLSQSDFFNNLQESFQPRDKSQIQNSALRTF